MKKESVRTFDNLTELELKDYEKIKNSKLLGKDFLVINNLGGDIDPIIYFISSHKEKDLIVPFLFSTRAYIEQYGGVENLKVNPLVHYLKLIKEDDKPTINNTNFILLETLFLLEQNIDWSNYCLINDIDDDSKSAIIDYCINWKSKQREIPFVFSTEYYCKHNEDVNKTNPFVHYLQFGRNEGREPFSAKNMKTLNSLASKLESTILFSKEFFEKQVDKEFKNKHDAIMFYLYHDKDLLTHPLININYYRREYRAKVGTLPSAKVLISYLVDGYQKNISTSEFFDAKRYKEFNEDIPNGIDLLSHYMMWGEKELRSPCKHFSPEVFIKSCNEQKLPIPESLLAAYITEKIYWKLKVSDVFDGKHYINKYGDVSRNSINPLKHYLLYGINESRECILTPALPLKSKASLILNKIITYPCDRFSDSKEKSILLVAHVAGDTIFGSERSFIDMVKAAYESGQNVYVTLPQDSFSYIELLRPYCISISVFKYGWWRNNAPINHSVIDTFRKIIKSNNIDIVHVNTLVLREAHLAASQAKIPSLCHVREMIKHDTNLIDAMGVSINTIFEFLNTWVDGFIYNSNTTKHNYEELNSKYNCISYNVVQRSFTDMPLSQLNPKILKVGLISSNIPKKGIFEFLNIAKIINASGLQNKISFHLIGPETESTKEIDALVKNESISNFYNCGYMANNVEAVDSCDVILSISNFAESFGRTVAEAFARKKLVICHDYGAVSELVGNNERGYVVEKGDINAIANILERIVKSGIDEDKITKAYSFVNAELTSESLINRTRDIYNDFSRSFAITKSLFQPLTLQARQSIEDKKWKVVSENKIDANRGTEGNKTIKIAYFLWHFPVPSETFVLNELRYLVENNYSVEVFCKQSPFKSFSPDFDIKWTRVTSVSDLAEKLKESKIDVVHSHFTYPTVTDMVWPACEIAGINFTFIAHSQDIFKYENIEKNKILEISKSKYLTKLFIPGEFHRNYLLELGINDDILFVNPQGVNTEIYPYNPPRPNNEKLKICVINRFVEKKGIIYLLEAARKLNDVEINIYGYGDLETSYREYIEKNSIDNVLINEGLSGLEEIADVFSSHDLFLAPAVRAENGDMDGIPTILMEAMAMGIPVAASDVSSISDLVIDGSTGLLFSTESVSAICEMIDRFKELSKQRCLQLSAGARARIINNYNTPKLVNNLLNIWQKSRVDIILVTFNNLPQLENVINNLYNFENNFDLVIIDNGSNEDLIDYIAKLTSVHNNITFIQSSHNVFVGGGTNIGLEYCKNKYSIYLCGKEGFVSKANWILPIITEMDASEAIMGGNLVVADRYRTFAEFPGGIVNFNQFRNKSFAIENHNKAYHVQGGIIIMNTQGIKEIGGFNLNVPHNYTDVEMGFFVESLGMKITQVSTILSLFEGSQPDFKHFMNDNISLFHPVTQDNQDLVRKLSSGQVCYCNICQTEVDPKLLLIEGFCPNCSASSTARLLAQVITKEGYYLKRKHALLINPPGGIHRFWDTSFKGHKISEALFQEKYNDEWLGVYSPYSLVVWNVENYKKVTVNAIEFIMCHLEKNGEIIFMGDDLYNNINFLNDFKIRKLHTIYSKTNDYTCCDCFVISK